MKENTVHVGFGFHVNCYHSYRGDTPDALGFGNDIRIIRNIINTLDTWNQKGIPAKGTWDFENAYSLEEILPQYAPDIITNVRRRQQENGDENILMGYNNGAMSAMTEDEFIASIQLAITNDKGSGLQDLFGDCKKIIRPQEVMFTPSQAGLYKKAGIDAICLYYSCVPFDAFRTLIPQLDDEFAFNPLSYTYKGDSVTIMPTYSQSDVMDAGSLRWLVSDLHTQQVAGKINNDVFIFINMDADSFLWEPLSVPAFLQKQPNCGGLNGLIEEISDLDFVRFNTVGGYLKNHSPLKTIFFGQDVADGNFNGYSSWAEKPFNRQIWTRLERARMMARIQGKDCDSPSFDNRICLLSTTHFGLATPVLNITREEKALKLSEEMLHQETNTLLSLYPDDCSTDGKLTLRSAKPRTIFCAQLSVKAGFCVQIQQLKFEAEHLQSYTAHAMEYHADGSISSVYLICKLNTPTSECRLHFSVGTNQPLTSPFYPEEHHKNDVCLSASAPTISAGGLTVSADKQTGFPILTEKENCIATTESFITYNGRPIAFERPQCAYLPFAGNGRALHFYGAIHLPNERKSGNYDFTFVANDEIDLLFVHSRVQYPYTQENDAISSQASNLGRFTDKKWHEVVPLALTLKFEGDCTIEKRNFAGDISQYRISDFWNAFDDNKNLVSFNHQLTGGVLCAHNHENGIALAHDRNVLGSMAHCPMRLQSIGKSRKLSLNVFGTYFGAQRHYPTRGKGCVATMYEISMPQAQSLAPAYNGAFEQSIQALHLLKADLTPTMQENLESVSDSAIVIGGNIITGYTSDNAKPHAAFETKADEKHLKSVASYRRMNFKILRTASDYLKVVLSAKKKCKKALREFDPSRYKEK